jgi:chemotaxis protein CheD
MGGAGGLCEVRVISIGIAEPFAQPGVGLWPAGPSQRFVVGIGELAVSNDHGSVIVTHALGSCVAICLWDPVVGVGGLIHVLLPDSRINPSRAQQQPAAFADTGIPLLFRTAYQYGVDKKRCRVQLIGGADVTGIAPGAEGSIGKRNILAARKLLWKNGVLVHADAVGGTAARTVTLAIADGRVRISSAGQPMLEL